jgi:hypothetical protein
VVVDHASALELGDLCEPARGRSARALSGECERAGEVSSDRLHGPLPQLRRVAVPDHLLAVALALGIDRGADLRVLGVVAPPAPARLSVVAAAVAIRARGSTWATFSRGGSSRVAFAAELQFEVVLLRATRNERGWRGGSDAHR